MKAGLKKAQCCGTCAHHKIEFIGHDERHYGCERESKLVRMPVSPPHGEDREKFYDAFCRWAEWWLANGVEPFNICEHWTSWKPAGKRGAENEQAEARKRAGIVSHNGC